jgi:hypothetical protein
MFAYIYVFVSGKPMNCKKNNSEGFAFKIPIPVQENKTNIKANRFRLWPAFSARSMRLGYNFGPQFRHQTEIKSMLSETISTNIVCLDFSGEEKETLTSCNFQLPSVNLQPKNGCGFSEAGLWKGVMGQPPPRMFGFQPENNLSISELS